MSVPRLAIVGVGLIGGSFALALRAAGAVREVVGVGRNAERLEAARALGVIDRAVGWQEAAQADCVFVAVPVAETGGVLAALAPHLGADTVVTDAGSTKVSVIDAARSALGSHLPRFVPGHPIAGSERSGAAAARADLFRARTVVLTPIAETAPDAVARVSALWTAAGAAVECLDAGVHDRIFAAVSHLPHVAAFALVDELARRDDAATFFRFAASGFRDFTRIAGSSPQMWRDIALANRAALIDELDAYVAALAAVRAAIAAGDGESLLATFSRARRAREDWIGPGHTG